MLGHPFFLSSNTAARFQYSCAFVNWSLHDLDEVGKLWNRAFKHARLLGPSTAAALLHFPADHGGLEVPLPRVILMKELETLFTQCTEGRGSTANIVTRWMRQDLASLGAATISEAQLDLFLAHDPRRGRLAHGNSSSFYSTWRAHASTGRRSERSHGTSLR